MLFIHMEEINNKNTLVLTVPLDLVQTCIIIIIALSNIVNRKIVIS